MPGGAGHVLQMLRTLRNNKILLKGNRFANDRSSYQNALNKKKLVYKEATPAQLEEIRNRLKRQNKSNELLLKLVMVLSLVITFIVWLWFTLILQ